MNYSSQAWQYMAMAQDGSSRLPMDRWTYNLLVILTQHVQFYGFSHSPFSWAGKKYGAPPNAYLFFVGNICGESLHENKKIWYVL